MADLDRLAVTASEGLTRTIGRLARFAGSVVAVTGLVGLATFATGWWVFGGSWAWLVVGGALAIVPFIAGVLAWLLVFQTIRLAPRFLGDMRAYLGHPSSASGAFIDHDSGAALGMQARSFAGMRTELSMRRRELPALYMAVRSITSVPWLTALALGGTVVNGSIGTVLLLVGVLR